MASSLAATGWMAIWLQMDGCLRMAVCGWMGGHLAADGWLSVDGWLSADG